jgi:RES domain
MSNFAVVQPDGPLYRLARAPDPWAWPDWSYAGLDGTFGNRWDDPLGSYRVLYASTRRVGAFVETLARFRPDLSVLAGLAAIEGDDDALPPPGVVPLRWLDGRRIGETSITGNFVDIGDVGSLATLRAHLAARAIHHGLSEIDAATIRLHAPRRFTQEISRLVYEWHENHGGCAGICYRSRLGDQFVNWAIFEPPPDMVLDLSQANSHEIETDDPDLPEALRLLNLELA